MAKVAGIWSSNFCWGLSKNEFKRVLYCQHPCGIGLKGWNFVGSFEDSIQTPCPKTCHPWCGGGGGGWIKRGMSWGTPLCKPYRYVLPQRIWFLSSFGLKIGIDFFDSRNYCWIIVVSVSSRVKYFIVIFLNIIIIITSEVLLWFAEWWTLKIA